VKQIFKSPPNVDSGFVVIEAMHVIDIYDICNGKTEHLKGWKLLINHPRDWDKNNLNLRLRSFQLGETDGGWDFRKKVIFFLISLGN
jgi:hypothetical protein